MSDTAAQQPVPLLQSMQNHEHGAEAIQVVTQPAGHVVLRTVQGLAGPDRYLFGHNLLLTPQQALDLGEELVTQGRAAGGSKIEVAPATALNGLKKKKA